MPIFNVAPPNKDWKLFPERDESTGPGCAVVLPGTWVGWQWEPRSLGKVVPTAVKHITFAHAQCCIDHITF